MLYTLLFFLCWSIMNKKVVEDVTKWGMYGTHSRYPNFEVQDHVNW